MPLMVAFREAFESHDSTQHARERHEGGERVVSGRWASGRNAIKEATLQKAVFVDLDALMNSVHLAATQDLDDFGDVRRSILNFGIPDVSDRTIDESAVQDIEYEIREAIQVYEPRLEPASIQVARDNRVDKVELRVRFVVRADLRFDPMNLPVEFVADVEGGTGKITISSA